MTQIRMYTMQEVATMFNVARQTLMTYVKKHNIQHVRKFGKQVFFTVAQLKELCRAMNYPFEQLMMVEDGNDGQ